MISAVDILSFDTQYQANLPAPAEVNGPPFSDYLNRAEADRQSVQYSTGPDMSDSSRSAENVSSGEDSGGGKAEGSGQNVENAAPESRDKPGSASAEAKEARRGKSEAADKSDKSENRTHKNSHVDNSEKAEETGKGSVKNTLSKSMTDSASDVSSKAMKSDGGSSMAERTVVLQKTDTQKAESVDLMLSADSGSSEAGLVQTEAVSASGAAADVSEHGLKSGRGDEAVREEKGAVLTAGMINDDRQKRADTHKAAQSKGPEIEVVDLRGKKSASLESAAGRMRNEHARHEGSESRDSGSVPLRSEGDSSFRDQVLVIGSDSSREDSSTLKSFDTTSRAAGELSRALRDGGNSEILKKAQFMLKEQDQGEIKLILKPEKLGEVRIRLNLNDKHIGGRIIVENSSVREVFQDNMEQLNRTFREHGFQTAGLDVTVGGRDGRHSGQRDRDSGQVSSRRVSEVFDEQVPRLDSDIFSDSRVNVYV